MGRTRGDKALKQVRRRRDLCARSCLFMAFMLFQGGCTSLTPVREPVPEEMHDSARMVSERPLRYWGDEVPVAMDRMAARARQQLEARYLAAGRPDDGLETSVLALSGGAWDGAYGAGVLNGWSSCGGRPTFQIVTGISTGALLAPFAFLGSAYDGQMEDAFTDLGEEEFVVLKPLRAFFGALGLVDEGPLARSIEQYATADLLEKIGEESRRHGRRLLIGTTNIDAERPVMWDIGALAQSGRADQVQLFRKILLASAAVPGAFPPVIFDVTVDGEVYQELHVDGGVTNSVFSLPIQIDTKSVGGLDFPHALNLYVIQNNKVRPTPQNVDLRLGAIVGKSISAMIRSQGRGDLYRLYVAAQEQDFKFHLRYIPEDFESRAEPGFNSAYLEELYQVGFDDYCNGREWYAAPPGMTRGFDP